MGKNLRIVIIDDDEDLCFGYKFILDREEGYEVVKTYQSFDVAKKTLQQDCPDVLMFDIQMRNSTVIDALPALKKILPNTRFIIISNQESENFIFKALSNGASGFITKNSSAQKIIHSVQDVSMGGSAMSTNVARIVMRSFQKNQDTPLTKRETEVLSLIAEGKTKPQVANQLFVDVETVRTHVRSIYLKLNVNSRADAIKTAKEQRLI